jgi:hypothetical protein
MNSMIKYKKDYRLFLWRLTHIYNCDQHIWRMYIILSHKDTFENVNVSQKKIETFKTFKNILIPFINYSSNSL